MSTRGWPSEWEVAWQSATSGDHLVHLDSEEKAKRLVDRLVMSPDVPQSDIRIYPPNTEYGSGLTAADFRRRPR